MHCGSLLERVGNALASLWLEIGEERGLDFGKRAAGDAEELGAGGRAGDQRDVVFGELEGGGQEGDECLVGAAIDGRRGEGDLQGAVVETGDGVAAGLRDGRGR